jgi:uncharacterized protein (TIGR02266 family)
METSSDLQPTEQPRKHLKAELRVYYGPSQNKILYGSSVDMSSGGLFLKTETLFTVNEKVILSFTLPDVKKVVNCSAKVAWVNLQNNPRKPEFPAGIGLQFLDLSIEYLKSIQNLLKDDGIEFMGEPEK